MEKNYFVHESSYVDEPCEIGEGTKIWHFSHVMSHSKSVAVATSARTSSSRRRSRWATM